MDRFFKYKVDQILFWALTIFFHGYTRLWLISKADAWQFLIEITLRNSLLAAVIYINLLVTLPRFMNNRKYVAGILLMLASLTGYVILKSLHDGHLYGAVIGDLSRNGIESHLFYNLSIVTFYFIFAA